LEEGTRTSGDDDLQAVRAREKKMVDTGNGLPLDREPGWEEHVEVYDELWPLSEEYRDTIDQGDRVEAGLSRSVVGITQPLTNRSFHIHLCLILLHNGNESIVGLWPVSEFGLRVDKSRIASEARLERARTMPVGPRLSSLNKS
jgi:hypothetical protein